MKCQKMPKIREFTKRRILNLTLCGRPCPRSSGTSLQMLEKFGIDEEVAIGLLEIKTQTEFAKRFNIKDLATLTDWNKKLENEKIIPQIHKWARKLTPNVIFALYRTATKHGKAAEVKAWLEIVEGM